MSLKNMIERKHTKQHILGQYMTTEDVAHNMCQFFETDKKIWKIFDPACGDGVLLEAAALTLLEDGISSDNIYIVGFDIDNEMIIKAQKRLEKFAIEKGVRIFLKCCDTLKVLKNNESYKYENDLLNDINIVIGNPPYGKNIEVVFFEECCRYFNSRAELVFLMPISFVDVVKEVSYTVLKGRPLGVTTGHVIIHHNCGNSYSRKRQRGSLEEVNGFSVLTGLKLYAVGDGMPPQSAEVVKEKPYSSATYIPGWLPCLRTGDIQKYSYTKGRLWVNYGKHLAHPKELERFDGPRLFVRRVPIWSDKTLGVTFLNETVLCAGDVLIIKHAENNTELLHGLCVYLNSTEVSDFIISHRPSVGHRDSFPKISAKDIAQIFREILPSETNLREYAKLYPEGKYYEKIN
ncbi:N-6 DNA methylase [Pectobacterium aroidearum]|uniref:N-6 DNA methylase n=1 Tax=Pectobacterium aroidearum TaxID=1201031 RepID=UPI001CD7E576|nr:TaqI-like C-terminal specificity domain-containing protein [Pectobacterium aroidearum]